DLNLAGWTQKITGKPAITVGSVGLNADFMPKPGESTFREAETASLEQLLDRMDKQEFDLVAVGRALITNPDWVNKVQQDQADELKAFTKEDLMALV
ncbi:MAG: 12-oxophytodienoate reductase, partial [Bermanella sp.]